MTTHAHGARRRNGFKEEPTPTPAPRFSMYRETHPEMYKVIPSYRRVPPPPKRKRKVYDPAAIRQWLIDNGPATAPSIATAFGDSRSSAIGNMLLRGGVEGATVVGEQKRPNGTPLRLWGII